MKQTPRWVPWMAVFGVIAGAGAASAWRASPAPLAAPATIGTIRLGALMDGLQEAKDKGAALEGRRLSVVADLRVLEEEVKALQAQIEAGGLTGEALFNTAQELSEKQAFGQARLEAAQTRLDIARGDMMREMYEKVTLAASQYAENNGYDLILVDDRSFPLARPQSTTATQQEAIRNKRILFARASLDVTDQVLTQMNNQYQSGGGGRQ